MKHAAMRAAIPSDSVRAAASAHLQQAHAHFAHLVLHHVGHAQLLGRHDEGIKRSGGEDALLQKQQGRCLS